MTATVHTTRPAPAPVTHRWRSPRLFPATQMTAVVRGWLQTRGSLTRRVRQTARERFELRLLTQYRITPTLEEARLLAIPVRERLLVREVHLCSDGIPVVHGRSLLPEPILHRGRRPLGRLGTRPLGEVLFLRGERVPGRVQWRALPADDPALGRAALRDLTIAPDRILWSRRALYRLDGLPLIVGETFLPGVETLSRG